MKDIRNSISHKGNTSISNESFTVHFDQLKTCIEQCCNFLRDKALKDSMFDFVDRVECSRFSLEDRSRYLEDLQDSGESIDERTIDLQEKAPTYTAVFDSLLQKFQNQINTGKQIEMPDLQKKAPTYTAVFDSLLQKFQNQINTGEQIEMPDITVGIHMKKCEREKDKQVSEQIAQLMIQHLRSDSNLDEELSDKSCQETKQRLTETMMEILSSDRKLVESQDVRNKCVMVVIPCSDYENFKYLLYQSVNGELTELFKPVERAIRQVDGYEDLSLEVSISDVDFWKCMELLVRNMFTAHGFAQENLAEKQGISSDEIESETAIDEDTPDVMIRSPAECEEHTGSKHEGPCILVKSRLMDQYIHMVGTCKSEPTHSILTQDLADILKLYYRLKYLSIKTSTKTGLSEQGMVSEATNTTDPFTKTTKKEDLQAMATASLPPDITLQSVDWTEKIDPHHGDDTKAFQGWGVCSLPDGGWLVTDTNNNALKRLDDTNKLIDRCHIAHGFLWNVCYIADHHEAAVTTGSTVEIVSLNNDGMTLLPSRSIRMPRRHQSCGVTYCQKKLYITPYGENQIFEHDYDGRQLRTICPQDSEGKEFVRTRYIASSEDGRRLFLTDFAKGLFILDTETANVIQRIIIPGAQGICFDEDVGIFVSGVSWRVKLFSPGFPEIHQLDKNGIKLGKLDEKIMRDDLHGDTPTCISYNRRTAQLALTMTGKDMYIFHLK